MRIKTVICINRLTGRDLKSAMELSNRLSKTDLEFF